MKVLLVYASVGTGHRRGAEAIYESLSEELRQDTRLVDILDFTPAFFKFTYCAGYTFLVKYLPQVWSFFYWVSDSKLTRGIFSLLHHASNSFYAHKFLKFVTGERPQVIVSTHFMPNQLLHTAKSKLGLRFFLLCIITDYTAHSLWLSAAVDEYVVALEQVKRILIAKGVAPEIVKVLGIPVQKSFSNLKPRQEASRILNLQPDNFRALLVTGVMGLNILEKIAKLLKDQMQVVVICGKNKALYERLKRLDSANIFAFGLVDNMPDFLSACDVVVSKAGGLTIAECVVAHKPMVFIARVSGQEGENLALFTQLEAAIYEKNISKLAGRILELKENPDLLLRLKNNISKISHGDIAESIISDIKIHVQ